jgi:hypothetical protein
MAILTRSVMIIVAHLGGMYDQFNKYRYRIYTKNRTDVNEKLGLCGGVQVPGS